MIKKIVIGTVVTLVALLIICLVPLKEVTYTEGTETHLEQLDCAASGFVKRERNPSGNLILSTVALSKNPDEVVAALNEANKLVPVGYVMVQNTDTVPGDFTVRISFYAQRKDFTHEETLQLKPSELRTVEYYTSDINATKDEWSWDYKVTPTTKPVQYPIIHYKKVTLLDYWLHY